jgi:hypothetical protein
MGQGEDRLVGWLITRLCTVAGYQTPSKYRLARFCRMFVCYDSLSLSISLSLSLSLSPQGSAKLEKAEILQMTVDHLRHLHSRDPRGEQASKHASKGSLGEYFASKPFLSQGKAL